MPGASALAWLFGSLQLQRLLSLSDYAFNPVISSGVGLVIAAVGSVPLGFLVYQLYSLAFNHPIPILQVVHKDAGGAVMKKLRSPVRAVR